MATALLSHTKKGFVVFFKTKQTLEVRSQQLKYKHLYRLLSSDLVAAFRGVAF